LFLLLAHIRGIQAVDDQGRMPGRFDPESPESRVAYTPHNISNWTWGSQDPDSTVEQILCRVCHGQRIHIEFTPLWDRNLPRGRFDTGGWLHSEIPGFPADSTSRMCLACHDGSIARAFPKSEQEDLADPEITLGLTGVFGGNPNTHLFTYPERGSRRRMALLPPDSSRSGMRLYGGRISCVTCHEAHDNRLGNFLREGLEQGRLCLECHRHEQWDHAVHGNPDDPLLAELREAGCGQCHAVHATPARRNLLVRDETQLCFGCHDGMEDGAGEVPAGEDLRPVFEKNYIHPVGLRPEAKSASPDPSGFIGFLAGGAEERTVRCSDCHDVHTVSSEDQVGTIDGSLLGASGVDRLGRQLREANFEYEICLKCHGFSAMAPPGQRDVSADYDLANRSYHPVMGVGASGDVPSLIEPWTTLDLVSCSDCHGNDDPYGPRGPHGSDLPHLLKRPWTDGPYISGETDENGLCYQCHDAAAIGGARGWRWHGLHVDRAGFSCAACHDPHGSPSLPGLLRFDRPWIEPLQGELELQRTALDEGSCTLKCHGHPHRDSRY